MGTWGIGIFADDTARDVRDDFRELIGQGLHPQQATTVLERDYRPVEDDPQAAAVFWLALAATQWTCGRLIKRVKNKALRALDSGTALTQWFDDAPRLADRRKGVLAKFRARLLSPPPTQTRIARRFVHQADYEPGDAVAFQLTPRRRVVWRVLGIYRRGLSRYPIFDMVDWIGKDLPDPQAIATLPRRRSAGFGKMRELAAAFDYEEHFVQTDGQFLIRAHKASEIQTQRFERLWRGLPVQPATENGTTFFWWRDFDADFCRAFGLRRHVARRH